MIYRSISQRMDCNLNWSYNYGELQCGSVMIARMASCKNDFLCTLISLTALRMFCYCHFVIRQDHGFDSVAGLAFCLAASTRATLVICPVLLFFLLSLFLFCKLWLCRVLIAAGTFLIDVDRFAWKSQSEFCVVRATHKVKSLGFVCSPSVFSLTTPSRLSHVQWFSHALAFRSLVYPWEKWGLLTCSLQLL